MDILDTEFLGNDIWRYLVVCGIIAASVVVGCVIKFILRKAAKRQEKREHAIQAVALESFANSVIFLAFALGQNFGFDFTPFPDSIEKIQEVASDLILVIALGRLAWFFIAVPEAWLMQLAEKEDVSLNSMVGVMVRNSLKTIVFLLVLLQCIQIISNQDFTTILAGLGVGAAALALASQQSIGNFFGAIVLFINRPFDMGDRIVYSGNDGPVEEVGIMCTKQRTLEGHLVTIPNGKLSGDVIRNISKRPNIRQIHDVTITYDTPPDKIKRAVQIIEEILDNHEGMHEDFPPRAFFNSLNADSLNIIVIYWYHPPNYWDFLAFNQKFLQTLFERYEEEGIDFAFPTQTVYLAGDEKRPLDFGFRGDNNPFAPKEDKSE